MRLTHGKMILYFDNYITDDRLIKDFYTEIDLIREKCRSYSEKSKFLITLYTLASYKEIEWSKAIIVYSLENESRKKEFEDFVKKIFPKDKLILIYGRSDTQEKYQRIAEIINTINDDWILYAGNNDHPFIAPDTRTLSICLEKAKEIAKKCKYVSVLYSHFTEGWNMAKKGTAIHDLYYTDFKLLEDKEDYMVALLPEGWMGAIQIVNKKLFNHWLFSEDLGNKIFRRIEGIRPFIKIKNQFMVIPKKELFSHFDGYSHTKHSGFPIMSDAVPPLFVPEGFFENKIKIRYGYDDYKEGWININPSRKKYIFEDKNGTDLKITLEQLPLFWKKRISKIDINEDTDHEKLKKDYEKNLEIVKLPFKSKKDKGYFFHIWKYKLKRKVYDSKLLKPIYRAYKKSDYLKKIHKKINQKFFEK